MMQVTPELQFAHEQATAVLLRADAELQRAERDEVAALEAFAALEFARRDTQRFSVGVDGDPAYAAAAETHDRCIAAVATLRAKRKPLTAAESLARQKLRGEARRTLQPEIEAFQRGIREADAALESRRSELRAFLITNGLKDYIEHLLPRNA